VWRQGILLSFSLHVRQKVFRTYSLSSYDKSCYLNDGSGPPCAGTRSFGHGRPTHTSNPAKLNKGPNKETSQLTLFYYYIYMYEQICLFFLRYFYNFRAKIQAVPVFFLMATGFWLLLLLVHSAHGPNFYFQFKQLKAEREREKKKPFNCEGYSCWWWWCNFLFDSLYCLVAAGFIS
jgi:hypothetical protein